jgi:hypothetical protein
VTTTSTMGLTEASYALWHELRQFIPQAQLNLEKKQPIGNFTLAKIQGHYLTSKKEKSELPFRLTEFCRHSADYLEDPNRNVKWGTGGSAIMGIGLERLLIANELWRRSTRTIPQDTWEEDITGILSFFSQTSQRRYEKERPQLTIEYDPHNNSAAHYGVLGKPLLDDYRALLRLCRNAHTRLVVKAGLVIVGLEADPAYHESRIPLPPQLLHLHQAASKTDVVIFNLNQDGSQEILYDRATSAFRLTNGVWHLLLTHEALEAMERVMHDGWHESVARNALLLALELAHAGEGALIFLCEEPTDAVLQELLHHGEGLIRKDLGMPVQELTVRTRFTQLIGDKGISLAEVSYNGVTPLLRDLCGIDGATVFSYSGELLGFGCLVKQQVKRSEDGSRAEGARTAAAKIVSGKGIALKVSSDGTATLFYGGEEWGVVW